MSSLDDFFKDTGDVERRGGKPNLLPRGVTNPSMRATYTRASSLAEYVTDSTHLERWERRYIAKGLGMRPDLAIMAASNPYTTGRLSKPTDREALDRNKQAGLELDRIVEEAAEVAGIHESANYGTAIHEFTEPHNTWPVPDVGDLQKDVKSLLDYWREHGVLNVATEVFTANDVTMSAGTFDHLSWVPGYETCVTDKKTGNVTPEEWEVQLASYSYGDAYNKRTDQRLTMAEYARLRFPDAPYNPAVGIIWHTQKGVTKAYELDLARGWERAQLAAKVRDSRQGVEKIEVTRLLKSGLRDRQRALAEQIAKTPAKQLTTLWNTWQHVWTDEHTKLAEERVKEDA